MCQYTPIPVMSRCSLLGGNESESMEQVVLGHSTSLVSFCQTFSARMTDLSYFESKQPLGGDVGRDKKPGSNYFTSAYHFMQPIHTCEAGSSSYLR